MGNKSFGIHLRGEAGNREFTYRAGKLIGKTLQIKRRKEEEGKEVKETSREDEQRNVEDKERKKAEEKKREDEKMRRKAALQHREEESRRRIREIGKKRKREKKSKETMTSVRRVVGRKGRIAKKPQVFAGR